MSKWTRLLGLWQTGNHHPPPCSCSHKGQAHNREKNTGLVCCPLSFKPEEKNLQNRFWKTKPHYHTFLVFQQKAGLCKIIYVWTHGAALLSLFCTSDLYRLQLSWLRMAHYRSASWGAHSSFKSRSLHPTQELEGSGSPRALASSLQSSNEVLHWAPFLTVWNIM